MEFLYLVSYNTNTKNWMVEDQTMYLDGNVWNTDEQEWYWPAEGEEEHIDNRCMDLLNSIIPVLPPPNLKEN